MQSIGQLHSAQIQLDLARLHLLAVVSGVHGMIFSAKSLNVDFLFFKNLWKRDAFALPF